MVRKLTISVNFQIRKLMLVGMLVMAGRGSVAQLFSAVIISFVSFSLQVKLEPYKHKVSNTGRFCWSSLCLSLERLCPGCF